MDTKWKNEELVLDDKIEGEFEVTISFAVLKKALNIKDDIDILRVTEVPRRNRIVSLRLKGKNKWKTATGDIFPVMNLDTIQEK
jgi:hypothetical protein